MNKKDADFVENMFVATVGIPIVLIGGAGLISMVRNDKL